jgi:hypothetical protein
MRGGAAVALAAILSLAGLFAGSARGQETPRLKLPVDCVLGETCFVQNYVDRDVGTGARDFTCGPLTYDTHNGTDIALPSLAAMRLGVAVRAAAPGRILRVRDGVPDASIRSADAPDIAQRECGNGIVIDHGNGWETQYCHMRNGSLSVKRGQQVQAGDRLGQIGLSGKTEFPHLHFTVRRGGTVIDPLDGAEQASPCGSGGGGGRSLWADPVSYVPTGLVRTGFAAETPKGERIEAGDYISRIVPSDAPLLIYWVSLFGLRAGDRHVFTLVGPDGRTLAQSEPQIAKGNLARAVHYVGLRRPAAGFPPGPYRGTYRLLRTDADKDRVILETAFQAEVRPDR